ncbi:hypothetical protein HS088_TW13G00297 [Tripterygium wilfordii]|uniref:Mitochondrial transcription termination factor family protein n=1 Tax=Tripterygium wilfordii TaxID=458696 RepID=A0A7J7CTJ0_TRIWF|nr:transcription termination factor MTEF1, chloroplastic [Tripterygium wilfordii]KAF5737417.1 hypothetical protein HS088_TW13G00297 [Tripterygium wilfordii]
MSHICVSNQFSPHILSPPPEKLQKSATLTTNKPCRAMQDTLHFLSNSKSLQSSFPRLRPLYLHHDFPSLSCSRKFHFSAVITKTTVSLPPKPPKIPEIPFVPTPAPTPETSEFQEKMFYLDSIGLDIFSLINHHRSIVLSASLADIKSTVDFMTSTNFTAQELQRIVSMCPEIISSRASDIIPVFTFLYREARVNGSDIKKVINRRPRLLVCSVKHRLRPTLYFLQSIGIAEVNKHTYLLSCSVEDKLIPRIEHLEKIGFSRKDAILMFRRFPQLFNYSVKDNLEPKFNYFVVEMGRGLKELKEFPQYFSFSLEKRIKPRHQCCVERGLCFPLPSLLKYSDEQFRRKLEVCCDSSLPLRASPLWCTNTDVNSNIEQI